MFTAKQVSQNVAATGRNYNGAAYANVLAIALYGFQHGTKDSARSDVRAMLSEQGKDEAKAAMPYSTAARQVKFGMDLAAFIAKKFPDTHKAVNASETVAQASDALRSFLLANGVRSGNEGALWVKTDGTPLASDARTSLYEATVKKAAAKAAKADEAVSHSENEAEAPAPEKAPAPINQVEVIAAMFATMSDEQLASLQVVLNETRKARLEATLAKAA